MNKKFSKLLLTSASAAALLAAYPSVAQNANEAGFDLPTVTAQAATSRTTFIREARALPSVANITADDAADVRAVRGLYNGLSAADKADADVQRWEGYLSEKEAALPVDAASFIRAARALPGINEITEADRADIAVVRDMYNDLPATDRNREDVQRWVGYVQQKVAALPSDAGAQFIVEARALPNIAEIEAMNANEFAAAKVGIQQARSTYRELNAEQRADTDVSRWAGYLSQKEAAFGITFQLSARALPTLGEIAEMSEAQLLNAQANAARTRALYNELSAVAKADAAVARWEGFLTQKEDAIEAALAEEQVDPEVVLAEAIAAAEEALAELPALADVELEDADAIAQARELVDAVYALDANADIDGVDVLEGLENRVAELQAAQDLADAKAAALAELGEYQRNDYIGSDREEFDTIVEAAESAINTANTVARVEAALSDAVVAINDLTTLEEYHARELANAKADALETLSGYDVADYAAEDQEEFYAIIDNAESSIDAARSIARVDSILADVEVALADLEDAPAETDELAEARTKAEADLEAYATAIGFSARDHINVNFDEARSVERVETMLANAISDIDEQFASHKATAANNLQGHADAEDYRANSAEFAEILATGLANIEAAESRTAVNNARKAAEDAIDELASDAELTYDATAAVNAVYEAIGNGELSQDWIDAAQEAVNAMPEDLEEDTTRADLQARINTVQAVLNVTNQILDIVPEADDVTLEDANIIESAREAYDDIDNASELVPTDAQNHLLDAEAALAVLVDAQTLAEAKVDAIAELNAYVDAADYETNADELEETIDAWETQINRAQNTAEVDLYLGQAQDAIDAIQSDADLEDAEAVAEVDALINALPVAANVTLADQDDVVAARAAFDALSEELQAKVNNPARLTNAEIRIADLEAQAAEEQAELEAATAAVEAAEAAPLETAGNRLDAENLVVYARELVDELASRFNVEQASLKVRLDNVKSAIDAATPDTPEVDNTEETDV